VGTPSTSLVTLPNLDHVPIPRVKPKLVNTVFNANKVQKWSFLSQTSSNTITCSCWTQNHQTSTI
jgi:hypothetical protein